MNEKMQTTNTDDFEQSLSNEIDAEMQGERSESIPTSAEISAKESAVQELADITGDVTEEEIRNAAPNREDVAAQIDKNHAHENQKNYAKTGALLGGLGIFLAPAGVVMAGYGGGDTAHIAAVASGSVAILSATYWGMLDKFKKD